MLNVSKRHERITLVEGIQRIHVCASDCDSLHFVFPKNTNIQVLLTYDGVGGHLSLHNEVAQGAHGSVVLLHRSVGNIKIIHDIQKDASLKFAHLDLSDEEQLVDEVANLNEPGAEVLMMSNVLTRSKKHYQMLCTHHHAHTSGLIKNYAVVHENGDYRMEACGHIDKGSYRSSSHQSTRVLTMSDKQKSEVIPILTIDENDVEASHAMSLGQIDEMQAYYLQSRGITRLAAMGLMTIGYFMPILEILDDEEIKKELEEIIMKKAGI